MRVMVERIARSVGTEREHGDVLVNTTHDDQNEKYFFSIPTLLLTQHA
jgi:hypothetical protein